MRIYLLVMLLAAAVTFIMTPLVRSIALTTRAITPVRERDIHVVPTPRLGGVAMFAGFAASLLIAAQIPYLRQAIDVAELYGVLLGASIVCVLGVVDDIWELDWMTKIVGQILAAAVMSWKGAQLITFPLFGLTIGSTRLSVIVTVLVVIVAINAINFIDGLDGLAAGVVAIGAGAFFIYSYMLTRTAESTTYASLATTIVAALVGICVGFLPHNFHPATIFMGDSGSMLLGLVLAAATIVVTGQIDPAVLSRGQALPAALALLLPVAVLMLPLIDMLMAVSRRLAAGKSPFHADRLHLHHRLLAAGHSHRRAVLIMYLWAAILSFGAAALVVFPVKWVMGVELAVILVAVTITINIMPGLRAKHRKKAVRSSGRLDGVDR